MVENDRLSKSKEQALSFDSYFTKLAQVTPSWILIGAFTTFIVLNRPKMGALFGLGMGFGYSHPTLVGILKNKYYSKH